ncbi:DUF4193 domain-containing protein [Rhodococcus artemisiae]|uniref:DUF4193 domain-containing protein n=1 Tax=Rhodococcus artemisiae TaxID=714159 RepID=A0ABU7LCY4_9NOCA|nr:DUF4193 domain-containing protein [Rhodococcus artemisiae]MEE2059413.1 DUF4193 domain-containing protein [Rhodococcus artemisiae]
MSTDYDVRRTNELVGTSTAIDELALKPTTHADADEAEVVESPDLPGADLSGEELSVNVVPIQEDEFTCYRCFLVQHHSRKASSPNENPYCRDCA